MLISLGEMTVYAPVSGGYIHFASRWTDDALGFALGWQVWFSGMISLPTEVISASILISYWDENFATPSHQAAYIAVICVLICLINFCEYAKSLMGSLGLAPIADLTSF